MDKYMLPFFFSRITPSVYYSNKNSFNQKNIIFNTSKKIYFPENNCFLPVDITTVDRNDSSQISYISRSSQSQNVIFNFHSSNENIIFNQYTGLNWPSNKHYLDCIKALNRL